MKEEGFIKSVSTDANDGSLTFEENKSALTKMIADIEWDMEHGVIEKKTDMHVSLIFVLNSMTNSRWKQTNVTVSL